MTTRPTGASCSAQLARWQIDVKDTASPREALAWIKAGEKFDVALLDLFMPDIDGIALADAIRALASAKRHAPACSSPRRRCASTARRAFDALLAKPVKPSALHDALVNVLAAPERCASRSSASRSVRPSIPTWASATRCAILLAEDNAVNQKLAAAPAREHGLRARCRRRRPAGDRRAQEHRLRRRADGRPDARARRTRGHAPDPRASGRSGRCTSWP